MAELRLLLGDALALAGMAAMTLAVLGILRRPDFMVRLHAVGLLAVVVGALVVALGLAGGGVDIALRGVLVGGFVLATSPISAHALGRAAWRRRGMPRSPPQTRPRDDAS